MHVYIAIQNTYDFFEMAFFINGKLHDQLREDKRHTSKMLIPLLDQLLKNNNLTLTDLSFIAVNCGPGPFSTLRSIIATANGLHCAAHIPLISIDGLDAALSEFYDPAYECTVVLLNAFNNDIYFAISSNGKSPITGYKKIDLFLDELREKFPTQQIHFLGNGVDLHRNLITEKYGDRAVIKQNNPQTCSINQVGSLGLAAFLDKQPSSHYLSPLHLKKHPVEM